MKKQLLIILFFSSAFSSYAQNVEMAKAFYKKALQAYEDENFEEALKLIEKTKENLNGNTNPDIIYIEAKSRYENDININKAKELFNQFLSEADSDDNRKSEVVSIIIDIDEIILSNEYYRNGNKFLTKENIDNIIWFSVYLETGEKALVFNYNNENNQIKVIRNPDIVSKQEEIFILSYYENDWDIDTRHFKVFKENLSSELYVHYNSDYSTKNRHKNLKYSKTFLNKFKIFLVTLNKFLSKDSMINGIINSPKFAKDIHTYSIYTFDEQGVMIEKKEYKNRIQMKNDKPYNIIKY